MKTPEPTRTDLQSAFDALAAATPSAWAGWTLDRALNDEKRRAVVRGRALQALRRSIWQPPRRLRGVTPYLDHKRVAAGDCDD